MTVPAGYVQLPGGYVPNPPGGTPQQQQGMPQMPQGMPQQQMPQQPQQPQQPQMPDPRTQWVPPSPPGAPIEGGPPPVMPQPGQHQQPQQQPQFAQQPQQPQQPQAQPQQPQAPQPLDPNTRISGPQFPAELQGRTVAEAMQLYGGMRQALLQSVQPQQQPQRPQAPAQPQQAPQGQPGQQGGWDWRAPEQSIARVVQEQVQPIVQALQPLMLQSAVNAAAQARETVARELGPTFAQLEPTVQEMLRGADPQTLANPQVWRIAAQTAAGQLALQGQPLQRQGQPTQPQQPQYNQWLQPPQRVAPGQQPLPNLNGFFTEQPNSGSPGASPTQLTPMQQYAAQAMGMSPADYAAWSVGIPQGGAR